jgi:hypothetical protein
MTHSQDFLTMAARHIIFFSSLRRIEQTCTIGSLLGMYSKNMHDRFFTWNVQSQNYIA